MPNGKPWAPGISAALIGDPRMSMASLAHVLSKMLDRAVVDKTGLEGVYEIDLLFAKTASPSARMREACNAYDL